MSYSARKPPPRMPDAIPDTRPAPMPSRPDSPAYLCFKAWWDAFKARPPYCPHADYIGTFVRLGAVMVAPKLDYEAREERNAIERQDDPL
jgi:hypothetical protein